MAINENSNVTNNLNVEDRAWLKKLILDECRIMMNRIMSRQSPEKIADNFCSTQNQSKERVARNTILFNLMTGSQNLPARPRDFRLNLPEDVRDLSRSQLSDVLSSPVRMNLTDNSRDNFPFKRGRPLNDNQNLSDESRGRLSYFTASKFNKLIGRLLETDIEDIKRELLKMDEYYEFLVYSFEANQIQFLTNEGAFMKSQAPALMKYGIPDISSTKLMTPGQIHGWAEEQAKREVKNPSNDGIKILFKTVCLVCVSPRKWSQFSIDGFS